MSILRHYSAGNITPAALLEAMSFSSEEITGMKNRRLTGLGVMADSQGNPIGDLVAHGSLYFIGAGGRVDKVTHEARIASAQLAPMVELAPCTISTLSLQASNWREQIRHLIPNAQQAYTLRVTMAAGRHIEFQHPAAAVSAGSFVAPAPKREFFASPRDVRLSGFYSPVASEALPQGLRLHGMARRGDGVYIGGAARSLDGTAKIEIELIDSMRPIARPSSKPRPASINDLFLDC